MPEVAERNRDRVARRQVDKFAERRAQLAAAALQTLAEQGYARTSLRDIAQNSDFSHGVLHYYFSDKIELITYCVRQYKAECVTRYDSIVASAGSAGELKQGFGAAMAATLREDATMHRLWYDLRNQSLFDDSLPRRRARDRPEPRAHDLAHRQQVRRARRDAARRAVQRGLRRLRRAVPAGADQAPGGQRRRRRGIWRRTCQRVLESLTVRG